MNPPLVSICIPTYNRPEYLRRAVESCVKQTFSDWEIIITDNSTNNATAEMAATWTDPRIRYFKNEGNIGATGSCNRAVSLVRGKYVYLLMDDDLAKPRMVEKFVAAFEKNPTAGIVMAPMELIDADDRRIFPKFYLFRTMSHRYRYRVGDALVPRKQILRDFLTRDYPCTVPSGIMYRMEALRLGWPFPVEADFAGDLLLCMQIATKWDFYYIDEVLTSWRLVAVGHTASLHVGGFKTSVFYMVTRQILADKTVQEMFADEWKTFKRDSIFFCSCRALLNGVAAIKSRSPKLFLATLRNIIREDEYAINVVRLPFWVFRQVWISIFPRKLPPPRE